MKLQHGDKLTSTDETTSDRAALADAISRIAELERLLGERAATADELLRCQDRYRAVMQNSAWGIVTMDANGLIESFNRAAERLFGYPADDVIGRPVSLLIPERLRAAHDAGVRRYLETRVATIAGHTVELPGIRRDETEIPLALTIVPVEREPAPYFIAIIQPADART